MWSRFGRLFSVVRRSAVGFPSRSEGPYLLRTTMLTVPSRMRFLLNEHHRRSLAKDFVASLSFLVIWYW